MLPICLHLDDRTFYLPYKENTQITIATKNVEKNKSPLVAGAQGFEIRSDKFSHFRFSQVEVRIPHLSEKELEIDEAFEEYKKDFFQALNNFIDAARICLNRYGLKNYYEYDDFIEPPIIESPSENTTAISEKIKGVMFIFSQGGLTPRQQLRSDEDHVKLQRTLSQDIDLYLKFISDAKRDIHYKNYIYATLNAVIALEISVSNTIRSLAQKKEIPKTDIDNWIKEIGLTGNIKTTLKLLKPDSISLPSDDVFEQCKSVVTFRNKIMHYGYREITEDNISSCIAKIEEMITFCNSMLVAVETEVR